MKYDKQYDLEETPEGIIIFDTYNKVYINEDKPVADIKDAINVIDNYEEAAWYRSLDIQE